MSPPGGDFSEPVTQNTLRIVKVFWALDADLANRRHFPAINWLESYSLYSGEISGWWHEHQGRDWDAMRKRMMSILQKENELEEIVQLVGSDVLPDADKLVLLEAEIIRESFLFQNAFHAVDTFCSPARQYRMMQVLHRFDELAKRALAEGVRFETINEMPVRSRIARMARIPEEEFEAAVTGVEEEMNEQVLALTRKGEATMAKDRVGG